MQSVPALRTPSKPNFWLRLQAEVVASVFMMLGIGALVALIYSIAINPALHATGDAGAFVWAFLQNFGIVRPVLITGAGLLLLLLGLRLRTRQIGAARWAQSVLNWLMAISVLLGVQSTVNGLVNDANGSGILVALPWLIFGLVFLATRWNIRAGMLAGIYTGEEHRHWQASRRAWNLLAPTIGIFVLVAITPLEDVFLSSLTNELYAKSDPYEFIGLENYAKLLSLRIDAVPCMQNADGTCVTELRNGTEEIVYPNPRGVLGDEYRALRFRPLEITKQTVAFTLNGAYY
ncbi:MAG: hypothetical protein H7Y11_04070, partial [Armatimonadetes bacterium]|nr:hypothetical protein [Anaerolineae bacterium]